MTDAPLKTPEPDHLGKIKFYRNKVFFRSILCSLIAALMMENATYGLLIYLFATVFWDWWFFSYRGFKESAQVTEAFLEWKKMTPEQIDQYVIVTMYAKRVLLVIAAIWACMDAFKGRQTIITDVFIKYTFLMIIFMGPFLCFRVLKTPYITFVWGSGGNHSFDNSMNTSMGCYNSSANFAAFDMNSYNNPVGYYNPSSPNYIFKP